MSGTWRLLYQDNHLLVVDKPAGLLVQGDQTGDPSLLELLREHRRLAEAKPGNVFVGLVHRLDRPVSGVVVVAKTSKAASRLSSQFRERSVDKVYWAVTERSELGGAVPADSSVLWSDQLLKNPTTNQVRVVAQGGQVAVTYAQALAQHDGLILLELRPETGRPHQLRVQASSRGLPLLGDRKYGWAGRRPWPTGTLALHARQLTFAHPTTKDRITFTAAPPDHWPAPLVALAADPAGGSEKSPRT